MRETKINLGLTDGEFDEFVQQPGRYLVLRVRRPTTTQRITLSEDQLPRHLGPIGHGQGVHAPIVGLMVGNIDLNVNTAGFPAGHV